MDLRSRIANELAVGGGAAAASNPGRARVCARRAAGLAVKAWYQAREGERRGGDAMKQLARLRADATAPAAARAAAERLCTRVDHDHRLPFEEDALEDARLIVAWALAEHDDPLGNEGAR